MIQTNLFDSTNVLLDRYRRAAGRSTVSVFTLLYLFAGVVVMSPTLIEAQDSLSVHDTLTTSELKKRSLEELMEMDITSVSKRAEPLFEAAAAVYIITADDIKRFGAKSIPEVLRLAPNLQVAQVDSRQRAISARGFNSTTSNKLLVLIDGRSVYTPLYSGVFWDAQDLFLPDIERIEVIAGPGATLWGANAVNGVINIITKSAKETSSNTLLLEGGGGTVERLSGGLRYSSSIGSATDYRMYVKYFDRASSKFSNGNEAQDAWHMTQGGFRMDADLTEGSLLTFQGDMYDGKVDQPINDDLTLTGGNILARWTRSLGENSQFQLQSYFDYTKRIVPGTFTENLGTLDIDFQHQFSLFSGNNLIWGVSYRRADDRVGNTPALAFLPPDLVTELFTGFLQDEVAMTQEVKLTVGSKFERNDFSGYEIQPSARIGWSVADRQFVWAAVSRAVRTPSRIDRDFFVPSSPPYLLVGGSNFTSEKLIAYEVGYRVRPHQDILINISTFYNVYDDLRSLEPGPPFVLQNGLEGTTYGALLAVNSDITSWLRTGVGYCYLEKKISLKSTSKDINKGEGEGNDPKHQLKFSSVFRITENLEADSWLMFVDNLPSSSAPVPAFVTLDLRIGWKPVADVEISLIGRNLLAERHPEFGAPVNRKEVSREFFGRLTWSR
ncbi:MAG: TonB-dependent receptor [Ignavibacteriae bacterium]|nr:TonB-dependent receptor [Ignavibacteria bacterium]MBI3363349.1 TonB-dependent receptor [Ignavibacteriota bacterium]